MLRRGIVTRSFIGPWIAWLTLAVGASCQSGPYLPEGDPIQGRKTFIQLECHACHQVSGEALTAPVADPPVPVVLGSPGDSKARAYLAESIIAPSHRFAKPRPIFAGDPPFDVKQPQYQNIKSGEGSRMGDYRVFLTVEELLNLVAYLESAQERRPGRLE